MFLTANALVSQYGVEERIAKFFVDREPPADNLYWKDKLLYLRPQPGYIFLPLVTDLYYRQGLEPDDLLSEVFVTALERIGHYSAQQEFGQISQEAAIGFCADLVKAGCGETPFLKNLVGYFSGEPGNLSQLVTPFRALHRGDLFLFSLCLLPVEDEKRRELVSTWFALITTLLLLDDAEDYLNDLETGDENAFVESGSSQEGFNRIKNLLASNLHRISALNPVMAGSLHRKFGAMADKPGIKEYLNA